MKIQAAFFLILALFAALPAGAQDDPSLISGDKMSLYGYLVNYFNVVADSTCGDEIYLRLKGEWKSSENLLFHAEMRNTWQSGNLNPYALYGYYGLSPVDQSQFPFKDFNQECVLDHYWASATLDKFSLQFGRIPVAWGTAYVFNPTSRASLPPFLDTVAEETPGTAAIVPGYAFNDYLSLTGYLAFQEKLGKKSVSMQDGQCNNLPYGIKFQSVIGSFDASLSWIREVVYINDTYMKNYYLGADFVGAVWDFGIYGETTVNFPHNDTDTGFSFKDYELKDLVQMSLGGDYEISDSDITLRFEYYYQGNGESDKSHYDIMNLLSGEFLVQAKDYLFLAVEKEFSDYYKLLLSSIGNLDDTSCVVYPEFSYIPYLDFTVSLGALLFTGPHKSEFNGVYDINGKDYDLMKPTVYLKCKISF